MTLLLEDHDQFDPQDTCVDPEPYTRALDWVTAFEYGGSR